jgi:hypothetical protein
VSGSYATFAARRVAAAVLIALIVSAITFAMLRVLRPESFADPRPLPVGTLDFLRGAFLHFDLGRSRQPPFRPVSDLILEGLPADFSLFAGALLLGAAAGIAGGSSARGGPARRVRGCSGSSQRARCTGSRSSRSCCSGRGSAGSPSSRSSTPGRIAR